MNIIKQRSQTKKKGEHILTIDKQPVFRRHNMTGFGDSGIEFKG